MARKPYKRASKAEIARRYEILRAGIEAGESVNAMAKKLGLSAWRIRDMIDRDPSIPEVKKELRPGAVSRRVGKIGNLPEAVVKEGEDFLEWLRKNVPEGSSLAEFLVSVAVDAWLDEAELQKAAS